MSSSDWPQAPERALDGSQLRRLTREATESHGGGRVMELVSDVYSILISGGITWLMVIGAVQTIGTQEGVGGGVARGVDPGWLGLAVLTLGVGVLLAVFARLGPMSVDAGRATWWLPMPADRAGLIRPRWVAMIAVGAVAGVAIGAAAGALTSAVGLAMLTGALAGVAAAMTCVAGQVRLGAARPRPIRALVLAGDLVTAAGPLLALIAVAVSAPPIPMSAILTGLSVGFGLVAAGCGWWSLLRLESISGRELTARGAVVGHAAGSVLSLDTRELGRALSVPPVPRDRSRSGSMRWVRGPVLALITGDALTTLRSPRHLVQLGVALTIALIPIMAGMSSALAALALVVGGYIAALSVGQGARQAELAPVLDRVFPLGAQLVRRVRVVWPLLVLQLWSLVAMGFWGATYGRPAGWILLGAAAMPAFAAGTLRGAYRVPPDWGRPLVPSPAGPIAPGVTQAFSRGPDVVLLGAIPLIIAAVAIGPTPVVVFAQLAMSALALSIACHVPKKNPAKGSS